MVKNTKAKGQRIERKARDWLQERGWLVERQNNQRFSNNDYFNKFDILAIPTPEATLEDLVNPDDDSVSNIDKFGPEQPLLIQVKANKASGVKDTEEWIIRNLVRSIGTFDYVPCFRFFYFVWHDRQGWRMLEFNARDDQFNVVLDQRD